MIFRFKIYLIPSFLLLGLITFLSNCEVLPTQSEIFGVTPPKEEINDLKKVTAIVHRNCLLRCPSGAAGDNILIDHDVIVLSSNKNTKFADWVAYKATAGNINGPERKRNWAKDPKIDVQFTFTPGDYKGMSKEPYFFDRGHQAPLASFKNHSKWYVLNYLSNITPQKKELNSGPWKNLEAAERRLVKQYEEAYVLTGPYYGKRNVVKGPSLDRIKYVIPSGYWKIISIKNGREIKIASFIFPQSAAIRDNYCNYLTSVPEIEQKTGLKIFDGIVLSKGLSLKNEIGCGLRGKWVTIH